MQNQLFPYAEISGTSFEIGAQHGKIFKDKVAGSIECYKAIFYDYANLDWETAKRLSRTFIEPIRNYNADYLEEIKGVAEGSGFDFEDILALNSRSELMFVGANMNETDAGCTSIAVTSEACKNGKAFVAHNWDWKTTQRTSMVTMKIKQQNNKPTIFMVTEAGIIGKTGYNSAGLSLFLNALSTDAAPAGLPLHIIMRGILDCTTISEAIRIATVKKIGCCANFMLGHSNGEAIDIEIENEDFDILYPHNGILVHTNHFISPRLPRYPRIDTMKYKTGDSFIRLGRVNKLLHQSEGSIDEQIIKKILSDHVEYPNSVCRHDDEKVPEGLRLGTVFSMIINLIDKEVYFAKGNPCEAEYEKITL